MGACGTVHNVSISDDELGGLECPRACNQLVNRQRCIGKVAPSGLEGEAWFKVREA